VRDHPNPREQFELLLSSGGAGLSPLDTLYLQILLSAFPLADLHASSSRHARLLSFLTIIALQRQRLTPETMVLFGLGMSKDDIVWMTDRLRSALLINDEGCVVPLHATFGEFLLDPDRCINPLYHINPSKGHAQLASACITALTFENISGYLTADDVTPLDWYVRYARTSWEDHLGEAGFNDQLKQQLMCLIGAQMPVYIRIRRGFYQGSVSTKIEQWLKGSKDAAEMPLEFAKSAAYSSLWWGSMRSFKSPNLITDARVASSNINANMVASRVMRILHDEIRNSSVLDLTVRSSDIARYEAVHEELFKQIKHEGLQEVWFPRPVT